MAVYILPRLDPAPLIALAKAHGRTPDDWAAAADMPRNTLYKRLYEPLGWATADRLAVALGYHPALVWGDKWWAIQDAYDQAAHESHQRRNHLRQKRRAAA